MIHIRACMTLLLFSATTSLAISADLPPGAIIRQGTAVLTVEDIDAFGAHIPSEQRAGYFDNAKRLESTLRQLLLHRQAANDAKAIGLEKDPVVQRQILLAAEDALTKASIARVRETARANIPDLSELAQERYQADRDSFNVNEILNVQHLLISTSKHTEEEARVLAVKVLAEAVANPSPESFDALVTKYSEDSSAVDNRGMMGDAGNATKYVGEFAEAANNLVTSGQISPVVKTKFGFHILRLVQKEPARVRTYAEVKDRLITELEDEYVNQQILNYTQGMQNNEIESNAELVNSLRSRYGRVVLPGVVLPGEDDHADEHPNTEAVQDTQQ